MTSAKHHDTTLTFQGPCAMARGRWMLDFVREDGSRIQPIVTVPLERQARTLASHILWIFSQTGRIPRMTQEDTDHLSDRHSDEVGILEEMTGLDLDLCRRAYMLRNEPVYAGDPLLALAHLAGEISPGDGETMQDAVERADAWRMHEPRLANRYPHWSDPNSLGGHA